MSGTCVPETCRTTQLPTRCSSFLPAGMCRDRLDVAIADADVGLAGEQRRDELRDVRAGVLIVGVGVDDEVRAERERGVDARLNAAASPLLRREAHDVRHAAGARDLRRAVARSVVDDQRLDDVDAGDARPADPPASRAASPPR